MLVMEGGGKRSADLCPVRTQTLDELTNPHPDARRLGSDVAKRRLAAQDYKDTAPWWRASRPGPACSG